jgi:hypothetical protein
MAMYDNPAYIAMRNLLLGLENSLRDVDTADNAENWAGLFSRHMVRIGFTFITNITANRIKTCRLE